MKEVTLIVADKKPDGVDAALYNAAKKAGPIKCNYITARENLQLGQGVYVLKPEELPKVELAPLPDPADMTNQQLGMEMAQWGKPIGRKQKVSRAKTIEAIRTFRAEAGDMIDDTLDEGGE